MGQKWVSIAKWADLKDRQPAYALVGEVDLVIIRYDKEVSVLYGRCLHRGALLSNGHIEGDNLICGLHNWDYRLDTGISEYNNNEALEKFSSTVKSGKVFVDANEVEAWAKQHPQPFNLSLIHI